MQLKSMLDVNTIKNLDQIKDNKSFEDQYDEGIRQLNLNRKRMDEFKALKEMHKFLNRKKS